MASADLNVETIRDGLATRIVGQRVLYLPETSSTMDVARQEAEAGAPDGTLVIAEHQTAGRGRFQRQWVSPPGVNLYFSILLRPRLGELHRMNIAATLAVARAIRTTTGLHPTIKWPNDVRLNGRKVCGILIENQVEGDRVHYVIVGIGINVNFDPTPYSEIATLATSLMREAGRPISRLDMLRAFLEEFDVLYGALKRGESVRDEWCGLLETLGRHVQVRWDQQVEEGLAADVDEEGNLVLERADGSRVTMLAGEVTLQV